MDIKKSKVVSIILMNMLYEEISNIIESELDKGDGSDCSLVDQLVELNEVLTCLVRSWIRIYNDNNASECLPRHWLYNLFLQ